MAWQTLPTVSYYHRKGHTTRETWDMLRDLLVFIEGPTVGKSDLLKEWRYALTDFEDALQVACGEADRADLIIKNNLPSNLQNLAFRGAGGGNLPGPLSGNLAMRPMM